MKNISVLCSLSSFHKGYDVFFPFYYWRKQFLNRNVKLNFYYKLAPFLNTKDEILILNSKFFQNKYELSNIQKVLEDLNNGNRKIVWFDNFASSESNYIELLPYVDVFLRRQVLVNKRKYLIDRPYRPWDKSYYEEKNKKIYIKENEIDKIKVGWNIGLCDYRNISFPLNLINQYVRKPIRFKELKEKQNDVHYRGTNRSYHRKRSYDEIVKSNSKYNIITEGRVSKEKYLNEIANSKIVISPFGYGEICHRDFETIIGGALLFKPDMSHLITWPNFYKPWDTFIPYNWDSFDLGNKIQNVLENYNEYRIIITKAQKRYDYYANSFDEFYNNFCKIIT